MLKNYVLDTNVLMHDPNAIFKFEDNNLYIPGVGLEELDNHKKDSGEAGYNVRTALKNLKKLRSQGNFAEGIRLKTGGMVILYSPDDLDYSLLPAGWDRDKPDNKILLTAIKIKNTINQAPCIDGEIPETILVTNDTNVLLKADSIRFKAEEFKNDRVGNDLYTGRSIYYVNDAVVEELYQMGHMKTSGIDFMPVNPNEERVLFTDNEFVMLQSVEKNASVLTQYWGGELRVLVNKNKRPWNIKPRNAGQNFMLESFLNRDVPLSVVNGPAGCGKTLLALACGLYEVMECNAYNRVLLTRANILMGEEIGFLPGSEQAKIDPLLRSTYDNLEVLLKSKNNSQKDVSSEVVKLFEKGYIKAEAAGYLRGRSIDNTFIIVDEAQNLTPTMARSIITRVGNATKIVLLGDPTQCDNQRLEKTNNGLVYTIQKMKGYYTDIITMLESEGVRSELSKIASLKM